MAALKFFYFMLWFGSIRFFVRKVPVPVPTSATQAGVCNHGAPYAGPYLQAGLCCDGWWYCCCTDRNNNRSNSIIDIFDIISKPGVLRLLQYVSILYDIGR